MRKLGRLPAVLIALGLLALAAVAVRGDTIHRSPLGVGDLQFLRGTSSVRFEERDHSATREYAHKGDLSETIRITADQADPVSRPCVYYVYLTPRAPVSPELKASLWLRSKTAGVQLLARVVLPRMRNPKRPEEAYTTLLDGPRYVNANNWQKLDMPDVAQTLRGKVQAIRLESGAEVDTADAYVDQLVLNLYAGPGETQVWVNELEIGPVTGGRAPAAVSTSASTSAPPRRRAGLVEINRDQLTVDGKRFLFRGIRLTDTPARVHKLAGFNSVFLDADAPQAVIDEVAKLELYSIPTVNLPGVDGPGGGVTPASHSTGGELPRGALARFQQSDRVLFWYLGGGRGSAQIEPVAHTAASIRETDPDRPVGVNAWDGLWPYSRNVDLLGVHRWPLHTSLELNKYRDWLNQRRLLARPGTFTWTWIQTHLPEWHTSLVYDRPPSAGFDEPVGPQPEHIRLLTYLALSAGCKGLGYWSDRFLAQTHQGQDRLLEVALLNLEIQLLEPVLLSIVKAPLWIDTSHPYVKAAVMYGDKGILVLPIWLGPGSQFVPGQAAHSGLKIRVPLVPPNFAPWEVTPADAQSLIPHRIAGGSEITLNDFGMTSAIVFTGDVSADGPLVYWQDQCRRMAKPAAEWSIELARLELEKVQKITQQLAGVAPPITGTNVLLRDARQRIQIAEAFFEGARYREAYREANLAVRPVRQLMRLQWEQAVATVGLPAASPYAVSYFTLPRHWAFVNTIKHSTPGENMVRGGAFEGTPDQGWGVTRTTLDEVNLEARFSDLRPKEGTQCLELSVTPKVAGARIAALEKTFLAVNSPPVRLPPGTLVRISAWARLPAAVTASADGALIYDNIGGEPLSVRLTEASDWKQYTLYRRVPASGEVFVTLALTGLGTAQFDDIRIEPMYDKTASVATP